MLITNVLICQNISPTNYRAIIKIVEHLLQKPNMMGLDIGIK